MVKGSLEARKDNISRDFSASTPKVPKLLFAQHLNSHGSSHSYCNLPVQKRHRRGAEESHNRSLSRPSYSVSLTSQRQLYLSWRSVHFERHRREQQLIGGPSKGLSGQSTCKPFAIILLNIRSVRNAVSMRTS